LPVVVTGYGAALDFCDEGNAYLVPAELRRFPERRVGDLETVDYPWLAEPDAGALAEILRRVVARPDEARAKGEAGCARGGEGFPWARAAGAVERGLLALRGRPARRHARAANEAAGAPAALAPAAPRAGRQRVSLTMIVRDEEHNLLACLGSVADLVDEVI